MLLLATLSLVPSGLAQGYFYIINSFSATVTLVNATATATQVGYWSILGEPAPQYYYAYEGALCPFTSVSNTASVWGVEFGYTVTASSLSTVIANGLMRNGLIGEYGFWGYAGTILNVDSPSACAIGGDGGGGGGDGGGDGGGEGGGDTGGCDYCAGNWQYTAACSGPYDHDYCGGF